MKQIGTRLVRNWAVERWTILILAISATLIVSACSDRFLQYQEAQKAFRIATEASRSAQGNSATAESEPLSNITNEVWVSPDDHLEKRISELMKKAKTRILLNVYILTYVPMIDDLVAARERGVEVQVLLERSVFESPKINQAAYDRLKKAGIWVFWASERDFNFNHAKYVLVDSTAIVGTGNFTKTSFSRNREFFVVTEDERVRELLNRIFQADIARNPIRIEDSNFAVSPLDSRSRIENYLDSAKSEIYVFSMSLTDSEMLSLLEKKKTSWVRVTVCLADAKDRERSDLIRRLQKSGISYLHTKAPYTHAKTIRVDNGFLLVWSINYTQNSLDKNREVALILDHPDFLPRYNKIIQQDCKP